MARYRDSVCRLCRREGIKLYLKGDRCFTDKCAISRRNFPPGVHGENTRQKKSEFGLQLREKQKVRRVYGLLERQFRRFFAEASRQKGMTGTNLLFLLERRLDSVVYRMGFATSRSEARQIVTHGHVLLNGKKATIPSMRIEVNDVVSIHEKSRAMKHIRTALETSKRRETMSWFHVDAKNFTGKMMALPNREELTLPVQEQLIVELYSR